VSASVKRTCRHLTYRLATPGKSASCLLWPSRDRHMPALHPPTHRTVRRANPAPSRIPCVAAQSADKPLVHYSPPLPACAPHTPPAPLHLRPYRIAVHWHDQFTAHPFNRLSFHGRLDHHVQYHACRTLVPVPLQTQLLSQQRFDCLPNRLPTQLVFRSIIFGSMPGLLSLVTSTLPCLDPFFPFSQITIY